MSLDESVRGMSKGPPLGYLRLGQYICSKLEQITHDH